MEDVRDGAGRDCCYMRFDRFYLWNFKMGNLGEIKTQRFIEKAQKMVVKRKLCVLRQRIYISQQTVIYIVS